MPVVLVDDPGDPRIADYRNLPDRRLLDAGRLFVAEGRQVVRRLLGAERLVTRSLMVTAPALASLAGDLDPGITVFTVPQSVMDAVAGFNVHRGCLAIGERPAALDWASLAGAPGRLVILERIADAANVGATFRNAAAFGAGGVLLGPDCADPLYRKSIRTSMAAALTLPFAQLSPWPAALGALRRSGVQVIGLSPRRDAPAIRDVATRGAARVAVVGGHEGDGLTRQALDACDVVARIPMSAAVDSLNVATAIGIALYELSRNGNRNRDSRSVNQE